MRARWYFTASAVLFGLGLLGALVLAFAALLTYPTLPSLEVLTDYRPKIPLRVYSAEGILLGEFGEERRAVVTIDRVPGVLKQAILAAEDERFYQHGGVDYLGVLRAAYANFVGGGARQGASTITMQVARNFFLTKEKTLTRKFNEMLLAFKIEHNLSKDQILELYINQIYLGQRAYGFAAAAQTYFGKGIGELSAAEAAMLAGLPKAPSRYNPVVNLTRAKARQQYVLRRMHDLGFLDGRQLAEAEKAQLRVKREVQEFEVSAEYVAEMVRQAVYDRFQEETYSRGFRVHTTIRVKDQDTAYRAVRKGVLDYDRRHGYRGPEGYIDLSKVQGPLDEALEDALQEVPDSGDLYPAVVLEAGPALVKAYRKGGDSVEVSGDGLKFAQKALADKAAPTGRLRRGSLIRIQKSDKGAWQILQLPQVEAALVSMVPADGAIRALVGGFDFNRNKFNHVTQAWRQPGSSFKPFIYSAALEKGFTAASVINDAPLYFDATQTGSEPWEPKNYDGKFEGPMRLRTALAKSKNLVSVRILQAISPQYAQDYAARFGFDAAKHPPYLTMALGAGSVTPMQMVNAYGVFASGGYRVKPYLITRIEDDRGQVIETAEPVRAGEGAEQVIDPRNAYIMVNIMQDTVKYGTAARAGALGRSDLAGKTGTTNEFVDAWFAGFSPEMVAVAWIGFDTPKSLGSGETGAQAALPMWMAYMGTVLKGVPNGGYVIPPGVVAARIDPSTGLRDPASNTIDFFFEESLPPSAAPEGESPAPTPKSTLQTIRDLLF
ncbi:MAG TPA: penicillin-binding protein 1A [Burkholderiales bacterium]|nr:penicillin-binding protein 1A [Burkholderiales bacterium]